MRPSFVFLLWSSWCCFRLVPSSFPLGGSENYIEIRFLSLNDDIFGTTDGDTIVVQGPEDPIFMQDDASCQKTADVMRFFEDIKVLIWPANSRKSLAYAQGKVPPTLPEHTIPQAIPIWLAVRRLCAMLMFSFGG